MSYTLSIHLFALKNPLKKRIFCRPTDHELVEWCAGRESNPHAVRHSILSAACIPIPSPALGDKHQYYTYTSNIMSIFYYVCKLFLWYNYQMPKCTKCLREKSQEDFFIRDKTRQIRHKQCKDCYREHRKTYYQEHYRKYHNRYIERALKRRRARKQAYRINMLNYLKDKQCENCGNADIRVLEFDHIDAANKSFGIARGIDYTRNWEELLLEIKKCRILCANCHKIRTAEQQGWYRTAR